MPVMNRSKNILVASGNKIKKRTKDNFLSLIMSFTLLVMRVIQDYASSS